MSPAFFYSIARDLIEFIGSTFKLYVDDTLTACPTKEFIRRASIYFEKSENDVKKILVFDVNNSSIFPLFVRIRNKTLGGDVVCITQDFSRFIYTILHAIMNKDLFDQETVRLSKDFENKKVKSKFEECGYIYKQNISDKKNATLQIDGFAIKRNKCYVVECKGWRFPRLIDEPETREHIIRDLRGIVLGKKYTNKDGIPIEKEKPSIIEKMEFVKSNIVKLGIKYGFDFNITDVEGMIITTDYPPISFYKGTKIYSIHQIPTIE